MRKLWVVFVALLLPLMAVAEGTMTYRSGAFAYTLDADGNATLIHWHYWELDEIPAVVEVPAMLDGHPVTTLGDGCLNTFEMGEETFRLVIPEGVTDMVGDPFRCCHNATEIVLPASFVPEGVEGCFHHVGADMVVAAGNPALTVRDGFLIEMRTDMLVYAPVSVGDRHLPPVRRIGAMALVNWGEACYPEESPEIGQALTLVIPEGVESIGGHVIHDNVAVSRLVLPDSVTELGEFAFAGSGLTEVRLGSGVSRIPEGCFYTAGEGWLTEITLPASVEFVAYGAFNGEVDVTALNPACRFETEQEASARIEEEMTE